MKAWVAVALATSIALATRAAVAVQGGQEDRVTTHAVAIARGSPGARAVVCSGTLVSTNVVLGVRHCFTSVVPGARACDATLGPLPAEIDDVWANLSPWSGDGANWKKVRDVRVPESTSLCGDDIALLVLAEPAAPSEATPARPVTDEAELMRAVDERVLGLAAFGVTDPRASDLGTRRSRFDIPIRCVRGRPGFRCDGDEDFTSEREITSGSGPCRGDSGGGALRASDRDVVFGVLSRGDLGALGTSCTLGVFERTDLWAWLIARTVLDAATTEAPAPAWATDLFPPSPRPGELCRGEDDPSCGERAACASRDERRSFRCTTRCVDDAGCSAADRCDAGLCLPRAALPAPERGCTTSPGGTSPSTGLCLLAALAATLRGRRGRRDRAVEPSSRSRSSPPQA